METERFEQLVQQAITNVPERFRDKLENVAFVVETEAHRAARGQEPIMKRGMLLGLYQGIPYGRRGPWYSGALPDKITLFQDAIETLAGGDDEQVEQIVRDTVWHEIAHYFGMDEAEVRAWEHKRKQ